MEGAAEALSGGGAAVGAGPPGPPGVDGAVCAFTGGDESPAGADCWEAMLCAIAAGENGSPVTDPGADCAGGVPPGMPGPPGGVPGTGGAKWRAIGETACGAALLRPER